MYPLKKRAVAHDDLVRVIDKRSFVSGATGSGRWDEARSGSGPAKRVAPGADAAHRQTRYLREMILIVR